MQKGWLNAVFSMMPARQWETARVVEVDVRQETGDVSVSRKASIVARCDSKARRSRVRLPVWCQQHRIRSSMPPGPGERERFGHAPIVADSIPVTYHHE